MSAPLSPEKAEQAILSYLHNLGLLVSKYAEDADKKATTEADYQIERAKARTTYRDNAVTNGWKVTESIVDDHATLQTEEQLRARLLAAAKEEATKLALRATQAKLDGARSLAANLRGAVS